MLGLAGAAACLFPADESAQLSVVLDPVPELYLKDTLRLNARVLTVAGDSLPGAVVSFTSSSPTVLGVDADGKALALGVGTATLTASALAFAGATPDTATVRVRGLIEIDSVRPNIVRFGDSLHVYGVGLNPDSLFTMNLGGVELTAAGFVPADPTKPGRLGMLSAWVMPPAARFSTLTMVSFAGGVAFPDTISVLQRDRYEPNDTTATFLGDVPLAFYNPALAFEPKGRNEAREPADWFTFRNAATSDRSIIVASDFVGAQTFSVFITDSLAWSQGAQNYIVGSRSWTIGPQTYLCAGKSVTQGGQPVVFKEQVFPITIVALKDLPAGTYHVIVPYLAPAEPTAYQLLVTAQYNSSIPRDALEENDYCDVAKPVGQTAGATLTIDNPHDIDWYRFTRNLPTSVSVTATAGSAVSPNLPSPDLDLYVIRDFTPDSLVLVAAGTTEGSTEAVSALLPAGDYFLVVVDFAGSPVQYTLSSTFLAPPMEGPAPPSPSAASRPAATPSPVMGAKLRAWGAKRGRP